MKRKKIIELIKVTLFVGVFLTIFTIAGGDKATAQSPKPVRDLVIAYEGDPDTLDLSSSRHEPTASPVAQNVVEYLCGITTDGKLVPGLTSWKLAPDKMSIDFKLRKGVKFHSGDPLTTQDVLFSYQRIREKTPAYQMRWVDGIEIIDELNFRIRFKQPDVLFLKMRAFPIVSKSYYDRVGEAEFIRAC